MRACVATFVLLLACVPAWPGQTPANPCDSDPKSAACQDRKDARDAFARALKLKKAGRDAEAFEAFDHAARLAPRNVEYLTAREIVRQQLVFAHVQRGNDYLAGKRRIEASAEFQQALALDPENEFARARLRDALDSQLSPSSRLRIEQAQEVELAPRPGTQDFHYRGDGRGLLQAVARAFGITPIFDESFVPRPVRFDVDGASFEVAMQAACRITKSFWTPLSANQVLVAANTRENHLQFDRMSLRVFYLPDSSTPQELNEILNVLRILFDIRYITQQPASSTITVRAPKPVLDAATRFLESFSSARQQVVLEMTVYEINQAALRSLGLDLPLQFQAFNITSEALAALGQSNVQNLINQLIASGGINQANTEAIAALLSQLQSQQNALFSGQPFATFGGGTTLFGVPFPPATVSFSRSESRIASLEHLTMRASQGNAATLRVGTRYPILNATFAPIFNSPQIAQVIANQSFIAPFPSFNYEDLGLSLKATPTVQGELVSLQLELEIRALGNQSFNGIPVVSNRAYKTSIAVKNGESAVVAGLVTESEQQSLRGIPGFSQIPTLGLMFGSQTHNQTQGEILVVITPRIVGQRPGTGPEIWLPPSL